jgi:hypothetical protein
MLGLIDVLYGKARRGRRRHVRREGNFESGEPSYSARRRRPLGTHRFLDEFALAYHRAVAERLRGDGTAVIDHARRNLES